DHTLRLVGVQDGHAVDGGARGVAGGRVDHVVRTDDEDDIGGLEVAVDVVHLAQLLVRHLRLGQQDVHVARHPAGDRVDGVVDLHAAALQFVDQVPQSVLRLGDRQAVPGHDDDPVGVPEQDGDVLRAT